MARASLSQPRSNAILGALPEPDFDCLRPHLKPVELPPGAALYEAGSPVRPVVGNEGVVGIAMFMGGETTPSRALIQSVARAYCLPPRVLKAEFRRIDRLGGNEQVMTQELIANMLGVRRGGVTEAASKLQEAGLIRYARGRIEVLDRSKLEKGVCECYALVKKEYDRLSLLSRPE